MRYFLLLFVLCTACAQIPPKKNSRDDVSDDVSLNAALNQAQMSYLKGCVVAFKALKMGPAFEECREKSLAHRLELQQMMDYNE